MKILWRRIDHPGFEWCQIMEGRKGTSIQGLVFISYAGIICEIAYGIECDLAWNTRSVALNGAVGSRKVDIQLAVDSKHHWHLNGKRAKQVDGCIDVDLGFSPSTNVLPIRRLNLRRGELSKLTAAWVEFPSFKLKPLAQAYRRVSSKVVHYESAGGRFARNLQTNAGGVVLNYPGLWESMAFEERRR